MDYPYNHLLSFGQSFVFYPHLSSTYRIKNIFRKEIKARLVTSLNYVSHRRQNNLLLNLQFHLQALEQHLLKDRT